MEEKYDRILEGIKKLEIGQAVSNTKMDNFSKVLSKTNEDYEKLEKRVDTHDKVVGAVSLAVLILGTMIKYKVI